MLQKRRLKTELGQTSVGSPLCFVLWLTTVRYSVLVHGSDFGDLQFFDFRLGLAAVSHCPNLYLSLEKCPQIKLYARFKDSEPNFYATKTTLRN